MPARSTGPHRPSGIRKRRLDRDGDMMMGAAPKGAPKRPQPSTTNGKLIQLTVTGWTNDTDVPAIVQFIERHANRRRPPGTRDSGTLIKKSRVEGKRLILSVRMEDIVHLKKVDGFKFKTPSGDLEILNFSGEGMRRRTVSPSGKPSSDKEPSTPLAELLEQFLLRRYDIEQKLLNLSELAEDEQVRQTGMFNSKSTQTKFIPALMALCDKQLKTTAAKREAIHSVTLSDNNLPDLQLVQSLAITFPGIKNLDLSGNSFASTKDILLWKNKFRGLEQLILSGNPLEKQAGWEQEVVSWYPRLRLLNGQQVRTDEQIARLDMPKQVPMPMPTNVWNDAAQVAEKFLIDFLPNFDNNREGVVKKYYDDISVFTMSVNGRAKGGTAHERTPWDSYLPQSRNLKCINNHRTRVNRKSRGPERILKAWSAIPPTRHPGLDTNKYSMDCQELPRLPDPAGEYPCGVTGLLIIIHGEYEEHRTAKGANEVVRRAFDRTFTLGPGGPTGVRVVSDMLCLRAYGGVPAWIPQGPTPQPVGDSATTPANSGLTPDQEKMVMTVHQSTNMTIEYSIECLKAGGWDLEQASRIYEVQLPNLAPECFVNGIKPARA